MFRKIKINNSNQTILWLAQILLFVAITQAGFVFYMYDRFYRWIVFSGCVLIAYLLLPKNSSIRNVSFYELVLIFFSGFIFLSFLWADNPALVWNRGFHWLFLLCLFKVLYTIDLSKFNSKFWQYGLIFIILCNLIYIAKSYIQVTLDYDDGGFFNFYSASSIQSKFSLKGNYVTSILIMLFILLMMSNKLRPLNKVFYIILGFLLVSFIFLFNAKGATIAFFALLFMLLYIKLVKHRKKLLLVVFLFPFVYLGFFNFYGSSNRYINSLNPLRSLKTGGNDERLNLWISSMKLIGDEWIHGVGAGNWLSSHGRFGFHEYYSYHAKEVSFSHAHNLFLEYFSELGILGFIALLFILGYPLFLKPKARSNIPLYNLAKVFILVYVVLSLFYGIVYDIRFDFRPPLIFLILIIGFLVRYGEVKTYSISSKWNKWFFASLSVLFFSWLIYKTNIHKNELLFDRLSKKNESVEKRMNILENLYNPNFNTAFKANSLNYLKSNIRGQKNKDNTLIINDLKQALEEFPYQYHYWYKLGQMYEEDKKNQYALASYKKSLDYNKHYAKSIFAYLDLSLRMPTRNNALIKEYIKNFEDNRTNKLNSRLVESILKKKSERNLPIYYREIYDFEKLKSKFERTLKGKKR